MNTFLLIDNTEWIVFKMRNVSGKICVRVCVCVYVCMYVCNT
jgi:hypothetical protein